MGKTKTAFVGEPLEEKPKKATARQEKIHIAGLKGGQRIKIVEAEPVQVQEQVQVQESASAKATARQRKPKVRGKKYQENSEKVDKNKLYSLNEAIKLVKDTSYSKFDGTVELHLVVKKVGTSTNVTLPYSAGKTKKIEVAADSTLKKLKTGKIDFDILLATAEMMPKLVPFAKTLGPRGLMPNPKNGTLIKSEKDADKFSANSLSLKTEKEAPLIHTVVGKVSQKEEEIAKNTEAILNALGANKQILKAYMKPTMGPSVKLQIS